MVGSLYWLLIIVINKVKMRITFQNMGWKSRIAQKRSTLSISINKCVAIGCSLERGQTLSCYLAEDEKKRPVMIVYLDGEEKRC